MQFLYVNYFIFFVQNSFCCSYYDPYRGVIVYFRVIDGKVKKGDRIFFMASGKVYLFYSTVLSFYLIEIAFHLPIMN